MTATETYRPLLFSIAYQMLGSISEAEDILQDTAEKCLHINLEEVRDVRAFLCKVVTRRSIDRLRKLKAEREAYTGIWLGEPWIQSGQDVEPDNLLSQGMLMLLERLNPAERAVFLLREVFDWDYESIAELLEYEQANCRQLLSRARRKLRDRKPVQRAGPQEFKALTHAFMQASQYSDFSALANLLREDVCIYSDGGGKVAAARNPLFGKVVCMKFIEGLHKKMADKGEITFCLINGHPGMLLHDGRNILSAISLEFSEGKIQGIYMVRNPEKLPPLS